MPYEFYQPSTGYLYPVGWNFNVQADSPTSNVPVPTSAVVLNATADKFVNVAAGTTAKTAVIVNFAPMLSDSWQDGQPLTLADIIYQYILAGEVTENPSSPVYDGYASAVFGPSWQTLEGFQILTPPLSRNTPPSTTLTSTTPVSTLAAQSSHSQSRLAQTQ